MVIGGNSSAYLHGTSIVAECDKQPTVVGLLLITFGDGGRGQVLLTVD